MGLRFLTLKSFDILVAHVASLGSCAEDWEFPLSVGLMLVLTSHLVVLTATGGESRSLDIYDRALFTKSSALAT